MASLSRLARRCGVAALLLSSIPADAVSLGSALPHGRAALAELQARSAPQEHSAWHWSGASQLRGKSRRLASPRAAVAFGARESEPLVCMDSPSDWKSNSSSTCDEYRRNEWCTQTGDQGPGWGTNGEFKDWASSTGVSAVQACCVCGGGEQMQVVTGSAGTSGCARGQAIRNEAMCRRAAEGLGATFSMSAHWPIGHPGGCHADVAHKKVWLNSHPEGTAGKEFAPLCAVSVASQSAAARKDGLEDNDDDDDDEDEEDDDEKLQTRPASAAVEAEEDDDDEDHVQPQKKAPKDVEAAKRKQEDVETARTKAHLRKAVVEAHDELRRNMRERVTISAELQRLDTDEDDSHADIDKHTKAVAEETHSQAMAGLIGTMWREMRMFSEPFYEERLAERLASLEKMEPFLKESYENAKRALEQMK